MRIVIDLDGTIFDLLTPWLKRLNLVYGTDFKVSDVREYNISRPLGISKDRAIGVLRMHPELYTWLEPYPDAVTVIKMLMAEHEVILASHCSDIPEAYLYKLSSVRQHFGHDVGLILCDDKRTLGYDILIDDCPMYHSEGVTNVLSYDQPYQPGMNWLDIYQTIKEHTRLDYSVYTA